MQKAHEENLNSALIDRLLLTKERIELGKQLYFDPRLSKSSLISCNTCHNLAIGGDDNIPTATGHKWTANPHHQNLTHF
jgi:cytochrome c peroxidase